MYASPSWWGFTCKEDRTRLQKHLKRNLRLKYCVSDKKVDEIAEQRDQIFFKRVLCDTTHVLQQHLPMEQNNNYSLRSRSNSNNHNRVRSTLSTNNKKHFIARMIHRNELDMTYLYINVNFLLCK